MPDRSGAEGAALGIDAIDDDCDGEIDEEAAERQGAAGGWRSAPPVRSCRRGPPEELIRLRRKTQPGEEALEEINPKGSAALG